MSQNINLADWHDVLQDALYWKNLSPDEAILYYKYVKRAHAEGCRYYIQDYMGQQVDLTNIFEQFILLDTLRGNYDRSRNMD